MSYKLMTAVGVSAVALGVATALAPGASAARPNIVPSFHHGVSPIQVDPMKRGNCYSSLMNDTGDAYTSQNFEAAFDIYDNAGADNFSTKKTCKVTGIYAVGAYYNGSGPADSETVTFYEDNGGSPGNVIDSQTVTGVDSGTGTFTIALDEVALPPGPKWVSVVVNLDFSTGGQWGWEVTGNMKGGSGAMWENPGDGFGTGCTTWMDMQTCLGAPGPDYMFTLTKG